MKEFDQTLDKSQSLRSCNCAPYFSQYLSWSGVIAGALVATGLSFLMNVFNLGLGLSLFTDTKKGVTTIVIGGLVAMIVGGFITMFAAGWVSGYVGRSCKQYRYLGVFQGLTTWCLVLMIIAFLFANNIAFLTVGSHLLADNIVSNSTVHVNPNEEGLKYSNTRSNTQDNLQVVVNREKSANDIGKSALITFVIFFVGFIACCWGGCVGVNSCKSSYTEEKSFIKKLGSAA